MLRSTIRLADVHSHHAYKASDRAGPCSGRPPTRRSVRHARNGCRCCSPCRRRAARGDRDLRRGAFISRERPKGASIGSPSAERISRIHRVLFAAAAAAVAAGVPCLARPYYSNGYGAIVAGWMDGWMLYSYYYGLHRVGLTRHLPVSSCYTVIDARGRCRGQMRQPALQS